MTFAANQSTDAKTRFKANQAATKLQNKKAEKNSVTNKRN